MTAVMISSNSAEFRSRYSIHASPRRYCYITLLGVFKIITYGILEAQTFLRSYQWLTCSSQPNRYYRPHSGQLSVRALK